MVVCARVYAVRAQRRQTGPDEEQTPADVVADSERGKRPRRAAHLPRSSAFISPLIRIDALPFRVRMCGNKRVLIYTH
jgi:hypothetical protein